MGKVGVRPRHGMLSEGFTSERKQLDLDTAARVKYRMIALAMLLCTRGECERLAGDHSAARAHLAEAEAIARELAAGPDSELGKGITKLRADLDGASDLPQQ